MMITVVFVVSVDSGIIVTVIVNVIFNVIANVIFKVIVNVAYISNHYYLCYPFIEINQR